MDTGQVVKRFAESEFSVHLNELFDDMPDELESLLNEAHDRYLHLIDVTKVWRDNRVGNKVIKLVTKE
jgi:hypothetical protein